MHARARASVLFCANALGSMGLRTSQFGLSTARARRWRKPPPCQAVLSFSVAAGQTSSPNMHCPPDSGIRPVLWGAAAEPHTTGGVLICAPLGMRGLRDLPVWSRALLAILGLAIAVRLFVVRHKPATPFQACHGDSPILIGTHHKTGTVLLKHIFLKEVCPRMRWRCSLDHDPVACASPEEARANGLDVCFLQHGVRFKLAAALKSGTPFRFIHAIRDPLEVVLSGYQYHRITTERWANRPDRRYNGTSYRKYLNALPLREGLHAEVRHSLRDALKTMPRLLNRTGGRACTLTVRLEDFERDWDGTTAQLWDLLGVDAVMAARLDRAVAKHNVYAGRPKYYNPHVTSNSSSGRVLMRQRVRQLPEAYAKIQNVRRKLGYPAVGREGGTDG